MWSSSNPVLTDKTFNQQSVALTGGEVMTLDGTVNKCLITLALLVGAACWAWNDLTFLPLLIPALIVTLIIGIALSFKQSWAPALTPVYAVGEGFILGTISRCMESSYSGIVGQAIMLTFGVFLCLIIAYKSKMVVVSDKFKLGLFAATGAIGLFYLITFVLSLFHVAVPIMSGNGLFSIGLSVVVTAVAALNLLVNFDFIQRACDYGRSPKYMEWYGAFALMVTLVWLYMEILRLLSKLNSRRQ